VSALLDIRIINGLVYDGSGNAPSRCDMGISGNRIVALGDLSAAESRRTVNAEGCIVCPGFIDVHTHSDAYLLIQPTADSKIYQGVTTEVIGNCGASCAPRSSKNRLPSDWANKAYPGAWTTVAGYRALLEAVKPAVNVYMLVGHNTLRAAVRGYAADPLTTEQLGEMKKLLEQCLEEGARGLSTGLVYPPGMYAEPDEIVELAAVVARHDGIYTSHMRSESARLIEAINETLDICRRANVKTEISHLKTSGPDNWRLCEPALEGIRRAIADGLPVAADRYPYTASCTDLDILLPDWAQEGARDEMLSRLKTPSSRARIRREIEEERRPDYWERVMIGSTSHPDNLSFRGQRLAEIAKSLDRSPVDVFLDLMISDELETGGIFFGMSEDNLWTILAEPYVMLGSDASIRAPAGPLSDDFPHPRAYGTFPRFLRAALEGKTVPVEEAIRKMTALPAEHFGIRKRGLLVPGYFADIAIIDPATVHDAATYAAPHRLAAGIEYLLVNGQMTLDNGRIHQRAGRFLAG